MVNSYMLYSVRNSFLCELIGSRKLSDECLDIIGVHVTCSSGNILSRIGLTGSCAHHQPHMQETALLLSFTLRKSEVAGRIEV